MIAPDHVPASSGALTEAPGLAAGAPARREQDAVRRIARNSAVPLAAQLVNKAVDLGFALVVLRALGPAGNGRYEWAVLIWLYTKTFTDFGLATLTTRDVDLHRDRAGEYLGLTVLLRLALWVAAAPVVGAYALANWRWFGVAPDGAIAVALLLLSIVPDAYSDAVNSICNAWERMVEPALLTVLKNGLKVGIGLALLAAGWGVAGLAATALLTNLLTAGLFILLLRRLGVRAIWTLRGARARGLLAEAWPLLLNNLLAGLFFSVDALVLGPARGDRGLGVYRAPYKFLNLLLLVPQYVTLALFPHLARRAATGAGALAATCALALKLLLILALPVCVATTFVAPDLMRALGGAGYLPEAGAALRLLIWFLPLSYANGLLQYVLIAARQQRSLTRAFALTFGFNLGANLLLTPRFGFVAASLITVASEVVLLVPILLALRRHVGPLPAAAIVLPPLAAAGAMAAVAQAVWTGLAALPAPAPWIAVAAGGSVYLLVLVATRGIGEGERELALRLLGRAA